MGGTGGLVDARNVEGLEPVSYLVGHGRYFWLKGVGDG